MDILMEEQMKYILMPSLQRRALIKTVITVWNQDDVKTCFLAVMMSSEYFKNKEKDLQVVEDKVIEKVQLLPLPESLKNKVSALIKPILLEVLHWWYFHGRLLFDQIFIKESLNKICWTPQGTIDKKKTAEAIIRDEKLSIFELYERACFYCLKNDILMLWNKIPENQREFFYSEEALSKQHPLVVFWTYNVKGEMNKLENFTRIRRRCNPYQYALKQAVGDGNQVATEYILQKLTYEEREWSLVRSAELFFLHYDDSDFPLNVDYDDVDVLCFLLSQMNEEQQIEVLKNHPRVLLSYLLKWPWQGFFMKMAKHVWAFLPKDEFSYLLNIIIKKVKDGFKDYDYQYLFREFWQQSPVTYKEYIISNICSCIGKFSLLDLVQIKGKAIIKLILEDLSAPDREKVIFSTCEILLISHDEIPLLEFFVRECLTTNDITIKFREFVKQKCMWYEVFQLLDDVTQKCDKKRCVEDGNSGLSKRFCS